MKIGDAGRFAPAPTGALHAGHLLTAGLAWLSARRGGLRFILRLEDLDASRSREAFVAPMLDLLRAVGITWVEGPDIGGPHAPYRQSGRSTHYDAALKTLRDAGRVYPCACSRADVARSAPHGTDGESRYSGTCRELDPDAVLGRCRELGRPPAWRFRAVPGIVNYTDRVRGPCADEPEKSAGDFVVARGDQYAYQLAVVADDGAMGVGEIFRGGDLLDSTGRQLQLYAALGLSAPAFAHGPLLVNEAGAKLSKRDGAAAGAELLRRWGAEKFWPRFIAALGVEVEPGCAQGPEALGPLLDALPGLPREIVMKT
jgi:glutamyl-tRNA synthetase